MNATTAAGKRRTHAERREEAERAILDAATRIVAAEGLDALTLADAGEAAGYSRGLPSHYFGSKADLLAAIAVHISEWFFSEFHARANAKRRPGLGSLIDGLEFIFEVGGRDRAMLLALHTVLAGALHKPVLAKTIAKLNRDSAKAIEYEIRAGMVNGEICQSVDAAMHSVLLLASARGVIAQWLVDPDHTKLDALRIAFIASAKRNLIPQEK